MARNNLHDPEYTVSPPPGGRNTRRRVGDVLASLLGLGNQADGGRLEVALAGTIEEVRRRVGPVLREQGISRAFLFGSVARGDVHERSDIDIAVEIPRDSDLDLVAFAGLARKLESALARKVDLVNYATLKPWIRPRVESEQVPLL